MRLITEFFSMKDIKEDSAIFAALTTVVNQYYSGTKITKIEESK
jgi:hypothetical protein